MSAALHPFDACALLPDGVVVADRDGVVVFVNTEARRLLGECAEVGRSLSEVVALQDNDGRDWTAVNRPYDGLRSRTGVPEQPWLARSGAEVLVTARITRGSDRVVDTVALVIRSGRGRARLDRERSDLVATVAHELRSPLTGVKGFVGTLITRWDRLNDEQKQLMLTTVHTDAERLSRLITELLDVARIDTGRLPLYPREVDPRPILERVVSSARTSTPRTIALTVADEVSTVHADPDKLTQVLVNLLDNAVRHGDGEVGVRVTEADGTVTFVVEDHGEGIPEEIRGRVFTKFWKHGVTAGSGLGMYLAHGLARAHGATLTIGDRPGGGARISVAWPAEARPEQDAGPAYS